MLRSAAQGLKNISKKNAILAVARATMQRSFATATPTSSFNTPVDSTIKNFDTAFEMSTSSIRFGKGVTREIGMDFADMGVKKVLVVTDPYLRDLPPVQTVLKSLEDNGIQYILYDQAKVEPTDKSFQHAIDFANKYKDSIEGYVAVGGGSAMDTAKAVNLYVTYPNDLLAYVNPPIGRGLPIPGQLKPLIAVPTTAGTGSEATGVTIFDLVEMHAKTGIAHRRLKPTLGLVDPDNTKTLPPEIAASTGFDVLCHAVESFTAIPFDHRGVAPSRPLLRPAYQGANPISDVWSTKAIEMGAKYLPRFFRDPVGDEEARSNMILAATYAAIGFGNAGVHLCHGMSYPISGMTHGGYVPAGYPSKESFVPHGISVVLSAPAVFRWTADSNPERHLKAAELMGANVTNARPEDAGEILANRFATLMQELKVPNGLRELGFKTSDIPALVQGTLPQKRVTSLSPKPVDEKSLSQLFGDSFNIW